MDKTIDDSNSNGSNSYFENQLMKERLNLHLKRRIETGLLNQTPVSNPPLTPPDKKDATGCSSTKKYTKKSKLKAQNSNESIPEADEIPSAEKSPKSHKPDIFTKILNEKKLQIMQDPEVIEFFRTIQQTSTTPPIQQSHS